MGSIDCACGHLATKHFPGINGSLRPTWQNSQVSDQRVRVQLRLLSPTGAMLEGGHHEVNFDPFGAPLASAGEGSTIFQVRDGRLHRGRLCRIRR